jgi:sortase (surface protein transpeptidase)
VSHSECISGAGEAGISAVVRPQRAARQARLRRGRAGPRAARVWAGVSALFALVGVAGIVVQPADADSPARLAVPAGVAPPVRAASGTDQPGSAGVRSDDPLQPTATEPVRLQIPALGVTTAVTEIGLQRNGSMEVPEGAYPVGWYDRSSTPGQPGPAVIAGHVDWDGERGAFYGLRELRPGDAVVVDRADGTAATFRVDRVESHDKEAFPTERVYGDIDHAVLRLITCGGAFDEGAGEYPDNVIVFASLIAIG